MLLDINRHLLHTINDMHSFEDELKRLSLKVYPSPFLKDLICDQMVPLVIQLREILYEELKNYQEDPEFPASTAGPLHRFWLNGRLQYIARSIAETDLKSHPLEIMNVFRDMIQEIDGSAFELLTYPVDQLNFYFSEILTNVKKDLYDLGLEWTSDQKLIQLTFPRSHKNNVLLSCIYAHEIGHYFDNCKQLRYQIYEKVKHENQAVIEQLASSIQIVSYESLTLDRINSALHPLGNSEVESILKEVLCRWLGEAIADCVGICLLGPAYITYYEFTKLLNDLLRYALRTSKIQKEWHLYADSLQTEN